MRRNRSTALALSGVLLAGCAVTDNGGGFTNKEIGVGVGAAVGGIAGYLLGGDEEAQLLLTSLGVGLGAWGGSRIGGYLDERQQAELDRAVAEAVTADGSTTTDWHADDGTASAEIAVAPIERRTERVSVAKAPEVVAPPALDLIGQERLVRTNTNLRAGPGTDYAVTGGLGDETVEAVGRVRGAPWVMVAKHGRSVGYVHASLLTAVRDVAPRRADRSAIAEVAAAPAAAATERAEVAMTTSCRKLSVDVTSASGRGSEEFEACQSADGVWEIL
jgi:SH3-like domain-containing protein